MAQLRLHIGLPPQRLLPTCSRYPDTKRSHAHHRHAGHPIVDDIKYGGRGGAVGSAAEEEVAARSVAELLPATPSFPAESYDALCEGWLGLGRPDTAPNQRAISK